MHFAAAPGTGLLALNVIEVWFSGYPNAEAVAQPQLAAEFHGCGFLQQQRVGSAVDHLHDRQLELPGDAINDRPTRRALIDAICERTPTGEAANWCGRSATWVSA